MWDFIFFSIILRTSKINVTKVGSDFKASNRGLQEDLSILVYEGCPKSKCTGFLFKCLLDSHEITSYLLQSMTLRKLHSVSNIFSTDHSSTGSHFL
jgi:hypothetical protein